MRRLSALPLALIAALLLPASPLLQATPADTLLPARRIAPPASPLYCRLPLLTPSFLCGVLPNLKWVSFTTGGLAPAYFQALQVRFSLGQGGAEGWHPPTSRLGRWMGCWGQAVQVGGGLVSFTT